MNALKKGIFFSPVYKYTVYVNSYLLKVYMLV